MQLIRITLSQPGYFAFTAARSLNDQASKALSLLLEQAFGDLAPAVHTRGANGQEILAYGLGGAESLRARLQEAPGDAQAAIADIATRPMPETVAAGRKLAFRLMTIPVARRRGAEIDAFRAARDATREDAYAGWLASRLDGANLEEARLTGFRIADLAIQATSSAKPARKPIAVIEGVLTIEDWSAFRRCLARGLGRHAKHGYGMLLIAAA